MIYSSLFCDSGAFSASRKGEPIVLKEYMDFLHKNGDEFTIYCNLDVIGDWKATWENQKIMESEGLTPFPVHHLEDPMKCLDWCLEYDHFALGGMAHEPTTTRIPFFDKCWEIITDENGFPHSKVHGFGMASPQLVYKYPWYSVDSSSWCSYGRYGMVILPKINGSEFDYSVSPVKLFVTNRSSRKSVDGLHFDTLSEQEQNSFLDYLKEMDVPFGDEETKGVSNDNFWRDFVNYMFFVRMCENTPEYPWAWKKPTRTLF